METNTSISNQQPHEKEFAKPFMRLITKIQHKNFEPGEFVEIKERTYEEAIYCINNFPWEKERDHIQIGLTNPSVTMESDVSSFLKLALFYNGKFVLHFFNSEHELYTKSFFHKEEAYPYIKNLFESEVFNLLDLKRNLRGCSTTLFIL